MTAIATKLLEEALTLSEQERLKLASELLASVDGPAEPAADVEEAWAKEIERRLADIDSGAAKWVDADVVHAEIESYLRSQRARRAVP